MELWFSTYSSYRKNDHFFLRIITIAELRVDSRQVVESLSLHYARRGRSDARTAMAASTCRGYA